MLAAATKPAQVSTPGPASAEPVDLWRQVVEPAAHFLDQVARRLADQVQAFDPEIVPFAQYALSNQGKQLRPALVGLSGTAAGRMCDKLVDVAVIIEMVHLATLVHDDVMDEARLRRRQPTLAATWGNSVSVLLGDCLFAHAVKLAASFPTTEVCRAVSAATNTVCSGEILQTLRRGQFDMTRADYFKILEMKTAELFALSCELGAGLAGASPGDRAALRQFGLMLGTAYQVFDDCVDLFGLEAAVGKSLGTDLASGKLTLPVLIAWDNAPASEQAEVQHLISRWDSRHLPRIREWLDRHEALPESRKVIHQFLDSSRQSLAKLRPTDSRAALLHLTEFLAQQTDTLGG
jgi:octaprenyl-diphosphate synthase